MAKKIEIGLDASGIIRDYRAAIAAMEQAGAKSSITSGLTKSLDRLEEKFKNLRNEGAFGKESSREIQNYQKRVDNTFSSLGQLGKELERISRDKKAFPTSSIMEFEKKLEEAKRKIVELQKSFSGQFQKLGFSAQVSDDLAKTVKSEDDVIKKLEEELKLRKALEESLRASADEARRQAGQKVTATGAGKSLLSSDDISAGFGSASGFKAAEVKELRQDLNKMFAEAIRDGQDFSNVWQNGIKNSMIGSEEQLQKFVVDVDALKQKIEEVIKKRDELAAKSEAGSKYNAAVESRASIGDITDGNINFSSDAQSVINGTTASLDAMRQSSAALTAQEQQRTVAENQNKVAMQGVVAATSTLTGTTEEMRVAFNGSTSSLYNATKATESASASFDNMKNRILMLLSATSVLNLLKRTIKQTYNDVKELDKSFASIAMVTKYSVNQMWDSYSQYANMASNLGQKTNDVIKASALFYQQGLDTKEALELTTNTMKLATLAGNDFETATQEMTSAIRGFKMEMDEGGRVTDVYSSLAAHAAASVDDIAQAMARTASIANSAGMSFENTSAFLTQMIETTQESAENIGTSLKTIIARFTELKENIAGTADSEFEDLDFNKVDKALKSVGVELKDVDGQFRNLDDVFLELSQKWDSLDRNTQRYVATIAAGSRQQSRFIAMMDNYERTAELMDIAAESEGKADEQFAKYADTMEYKLNQLNTKWEEFRVNILNSDVFKGLIDSLGVFLDKIQNIKWKRLIVLGPVAIWAAKSFISTFFTTLKSSINTLSSIGTLAGTKILTGFNKVLKKGVQIPTAIDYKAALQTKNQITTLVNDSNKMLAKNGGVNILQQVDTSKMNGMLNSYYALAQAGRDVGLSEQEADKAAKQMLQTFGANGQKAREMATELQNADAVIKQFNQNQARLEGMRQGFAAVGQAAISAFAMIASGADAIDVLKMMSIQLTVMAAQFALQEVLARVHQKQLTKLQLKGGAERVAAVTAEQAAETAAITAGGAAQAAAAEATGLAVGGGLTTGFITGTAGIGAIVVAIAAAITGLVVLVSSLIKNAKAGKKTAQEELEDAKKAAEEANKIAVQSKESKTNAEKEATAAKELKEEYEELANKVVRTTEEQTRYEELVQQIRDELPSVVVSYNEITKELVTQNTLWDDIIKKANLAAKEANRNDYVAQLALINADEDVTNSQFKVDTENASIYQNAIAKLNNKKFSIYDDETYAYTEGSFGDWIKDYFGDHDINSLSEGDINDIIESLKYNIDYEDVSDFGYFLESIQQQGADMRQIFQGMEYMGDTFEESTNANALYLKEYIESNDNFIKKQEEVRDDELDLNKQRRHAQRASMIESEFDVSKSVADFMAGMMEASMPSQSEINDMAEELFNDGISNGQKFRNASDMEKYAEKNHGFGADNLKTWSETVKEIDSNGVKVQEVFERINSMIDEQGLDLEKLTSSGWNDAKNDDEKWKKYVDTLQYFDEAYQQIYEQRQAELAKLTEKEQTAVEEFYSSMNDLTVDGLNKAKTTLQNSMETDSGKAYAGTAVDDAIKSLQEKITAVAANTGIAEGSLDGWTQNELTKLDDAFSKLSEHAKIGADTFTNSLMSTLAENEDLTKNQILAMMQIPWDEIDLTNFSQYQDQILEILEETLDEEEAKKLADKFVTEATKAGIASFGVKSQDVVDSITDSIEEGLEKWVKGYSDLSSAITSQLKDGFISFTQSQEVEKALAELGLEASEFLDFTDDGKVILNEEKLTQEFKNQLNNADAILEVANKETQAKIDELKIQRDSIIAERDLLIATKQRLAAEQDILITRQQQYNMNLSGWAKTYADKALDIYKAQRAETTEEINNINSEYADKLKDINTQIAEYQSGLNSIKPGSKEYLETQNKIKAALRELSTMRDSYLPDEEKVKSVADATKDHEQALEDLAKAQEDVAEKQEKLNEALEEYNDLLYGKDNRKSSLDYLYNYDEAINSFNDEISRSKDLLADSKSIEDSTVALQRYANATHNLVAEETAKQQVIQAGLKNYADMIENGNYAYTNRETGQTTNVNFGDYARKDNRTGKYVIDQRLINEAKFTDDIKDLLEEQVSNYNKYRDELLKSEDNVRKAEKELQEQRKTALNNYAAMETEIAEALKAQYQEEVDALKDKYDAMKDADDDYLDALQDAIDKQRQLRDKENKYEDLAQKEKKLSLMQRDTSGANELETRQLEKEVQQDRESLLDEAIDEVIDGLSELYESQQELRDSEMELKEALLDNTLYWNTQAEGLAGSFESAEDYAQFLSSLSEEYSMMTLAQQQVKLQEYGETYTAASEYMAMQAMDSASETGDFVIDTMTITGEEVGTIVAETAETFSTEVIRSYNETTAAFEEDMRKAEESIDSAKQALQEAINKLNECAAAANTAAQALRDAQAAQSSGGGDLGYEDNFGGAESTYVGPASGQLVDWVNLKDTMDGMAYSINSNGSVENGTIAFGANSSTTHGQLASYIQKLYRGNELAELQQVTTALGLSTTDGNSSTPLNSYQLYNKIKERLIAADATLTSVFKYKEGGLVNYTGPAWVDGSPERPEAFLNSEDTARIGDAAKILADIPWMDRDTDNASVVTNNGGDVSVEINLNIDHISSDTDIDEMIQRVKDEIVDVARPEGTNVILQQQLN